MKIRSLVHVAAALLIFEIAENFSMASSEIFYRFWESAIAAEIFSVFISMFSVIFLVRLYMVYVMKTPVQEFYMGKPAWEKLWCAAAVVMPMAVSLFYLFFVEGELRVERLPISESAYAVCVSLLSMGLRAAVTEEVIFRGMILGNLRKALGTKAALAVSALLFMLLHLINADMYSRRETVMICVSVFIAGTALGLVTLETGSIWSSVVIHALYNILSGESQIFHIDVEQNFPALCTYTLHSKNWMFTGSRSSVGLTAALPSIVGFSAIGLLALWKIFCRNNRQNDRIVFSPIFWEGNFQSGRKENGKTLHIDH